MTDYEVLEIGALDDWRAFHGGFRPDTRRDGRRVLDQELAMQFIGMTANAMAPGEAAGYWHSHSRIEEVYVFLAGRGQMGLAAADDDSDDDGDRVDDGGPAVVEVGPGTVVRVGQHVWRTWRCDPDATEPLRWLCIRAGGETLPALPDDAARAEGRPMPW